MKRFKKLLAVFAAAVIAVTSVPIAANTTVYADEYTIRLDGRKLNTNQPIVNVNNRILVPYRELAEAMDAKVGWNPKTTTVTMYRGNLYSRLQIGDDTLYYGKFGYDEDGEIVELTNKWEIMDVEATIIDNSTYIPVRAVAEALGAEVDWDKITGTANITSKAIEEPDEIEDEPDEKEDDKKAANYGDFSNTTYFRTISSETAKNRYQDANNDPFIFVLYDSSSNSAKKIVPNIQDAASDAKTRIYAVDMNDSNYSAKDVNFLWSHFNEDKFEDPTVYFVYSKKDIEENKAPTDMNKLSDQISKFETKAQTDIDYGDFKDTTYFKSKKDTYIETLIDNDDEFILVVYDSTDEDSALYIPVIKTAAANKKQIVYGLDIDRYTKFYKNVEILEDYEDDTDELPLVFLVYDGIFDFEVFEQPSTVSEMEDYIDEFRDYATNSGSYSDFTSSRYYTNASISDVNTLVSTTSKNNTNDYIIFIYDSSDYDMMETIENILDSVITNSTYRDLADYYLINESSNNYKENHDKTNYNSWYSEQQFTSKSSRPLILHIKEGKVVDSAANINTTGKAKSFLNNLKKK